MIGGDVVCLEVHAMGGSGRDMEVLRLDGIGLGTREGGLEGGGRERGREGIYTRIIVDSYFLGPNCSSGGSD